MGLEEGPEYGGPDGVSSKEVEVADPDRWMACAWRMGAKALTPGAKRMARRDEENFILVVQRELWYVYWMLICFQVLSLVVSSTA